MIVDSLLKEKGNKFLWIPVFIGIGIISPINFILLLLPILIGSIIHNNNNYIIIVLLIITGSVAINARIHILNTHLITKSLYIHKAIGKVYEINHKTSYDQLTLYQLKHRKLKGLSKIRIKVYHLADTISSGDYVLFSAKLIPPSLPVAPYAYNFARFAYFDQISAVGFAVAPIQLYAKHKQLFTLSIDNFRNHITQSFITAMGPRNGNIAAALIVGKRQGIQKNIMENIRKSGLAHLLAISGLHLTIVTFFFFIFFRKMLGFSIFITTRYNTKKLAAVAGISASFIYLIISGMPISAQRAFIMVCLLLTSILIDRNSSTMRSVMVAATIILLLKPESIFKPSFQMSFSAVIGLCAFYESYKKLYIHNRFYRICGYFTSITLSSIVASLSTTPYTIYHFNYLSLGGIVANLFAIPLTTFIILPCGIISVISAPLHLSILPNAIMSKGISALIYLSNKIGSMPYSSLPVHTFNNLSIVIITFGFLWLCLWQQRWRFFSIPIIISGCLIGLNYKTPDILANTKMVAIKGHDKNLYFLAKQRKNFISNTWIAKNGQSKIYSYTQHQNNTKVNINCNDNYCQYVNDKHSILFLYSESHRMNYDTFDYVIQLKSFPIQRKSNVITFEQLHEGYFIWLSK